jgi:hypothetical protein
VFSLLGAGAMPKKLLPHPVSNDHFVAFGTIINIMVDIDGSLDQMIIAIVRGDPTILPLLTLLGQKDKVDYISAMVKESTLSSIAISGLDGLLSRVRKAAGLRNQIAHCHWTAGSKPGAIKPMMLSSRTTLKTLGLEYYEKQWTAPELMAEARRFIELNNDLKTFMVRYGLMPRMWRIRSGKKSRKSASKGG